MSILRRIVTFKNGKKSVHFVTMGDGMPMGDEATDYYNACIAGCAVGDQACVNNCSGFLTGNPVMDPSAGPTSSSSSGSSGSSSTSSTTPSSGSSTIPIAPASATGVNAGMTSASLSSISSLFGGNTLLMLGAAGVAAYFLFKKPKKKGP